MDIRKPSALLNGCAVLLLAIAAGSCLAVWAQEVQPELVALVGGRLIDGTGAEPVADTVIVIQDGTILSALPRDEVEIPLRAEVIDISGLTVLPGFFNCHVHFTTDPGHLETWAYEGVTTVRDLGIPLAYVRDFRGHDEWQRDPHLARALFAGPIINVPGGRQHGSPYGIVIWSESNTQETIEHLIDNGADVIKVYLEDGEFGNDTFSVISLEMMQTVVRVAHGRGIKVAAHAHTGPFVEQALDGGVDDVAHTQYDEPLPASLIERLVEQDVSVVPTLEILQVPWMRSMAMTNLRLLHEGGVKIALGTDFDIQWGLELGMPLTEMRLMEAAGMTPMDIIVAATMNGAEVCGLGAEVGTVSRGKVADLIVVDGDPLADIGVLKNNVMLVFHYGELVRDDRETVSGSASLRRPSGRRAPVYGGNQ